MQDIMVTMASMTRAPASAADLALALALGTELGAEQAPEVDMELAVAVALRLVLDMAPAVVTGWALSRLAQVRPSCSITFSTLGFALLVSQCALGLCLWAVLISYVHHLCGACQAVDMCCSHGQTSSDYSCVMWLHSCVLAALY